MNLWAKNSFRTCNEPENSVALLLTNPPCSSQFEKGNKNSDNDIFVQVDMKYFVQSFYDVMKSGSNAHLFWFPMQKTDWMYEINQHKTDVSAPTMKNEGLGWYEDNILLQKRKDAFVVYFYTGYLQHLFRFE